MRKFFILMVVAGICGESLWGAAQKIPLKDLNVTNTVYTANSVDELIQGGGAPNYEAVSNAAMNAHTELTNATSVLRGKGELAVYKKAGIGNVWTLVDSGGHSYSGITGEYDNGYFAFYLNGNYVAGSEGLYASNAMQVAYIGDIAVGGGGTAYRDNFEWIATSDSLAKTSDMQLKPVFNDWTISPVPAEEWSVRWVQDQWCLAIEGFEIAFSAVGDYYANRLTGTWNDITYTATRHIIGYALGSQTNKVLASASDLSSKASTNDVTLTIAPEWSEWSVSPDPLSYPGAASWYIFYAPEPFPQSPWVLTIEDAGGMMITEKYSAGDENATVLHLTDGYSEYTYTATRTRLPKGYVLGSQTNYVLAATEALTSGDLIPAKAEEATYALGLKVTNSTARAVDATIRTADSIINQLDTATTNIDTLTQKVTVGGRYALFVVNLNPGETRDWSGIELKATTNNFASGSQNMLFFASTAKNGTDTSSLGFTQDWCRVYILSKRVDSDIRKWKQIKNTDALVQDDELVYAPLELAIIVDPTLLKRGQGSNWLSEGNKELIWSYVRIGLGPAETDQDGVPCWRPIMPVKWYSELPAWANQLDSAVDTTSITPYLPPWTAEIEGLDASYKRFTGITNVNQSVQYVTLSASQTTLNITMPLNGETKDWIVYVNAATNTNIVLPSGNWWMNDFSYTNAIPGGVPTALFFSQVTDGTFTLGRIEMKTLTIP